MAAPTALRAGIPSPNSAADKDGIVFTGKRKGAKDSKNSPARRGIFDRGGSGQGDVKKTGRRAGGY